MAIAQSTPQAHFPQPVTTDENLDLIRRYCPSIPLETQQQLAAQIVATSNGCWHWPGNSTKTGYRSITLKAAHWDDWRGVSLHRYIYDTLITPIPTGIHIHHRCEHPPCWHPLHLEGVTPIEHIARHRPSVPSVTPQREPWRPPVQLALFVLNS